MAKHSNRNGIVVFWWIWNVGGRYGKFYTLTEVCIAVILGFYTIEHQQQIKFVKINTLIYQ